MLSLQLQMVENLVIAKAQEETLQWKMEEQRLQLQEAANRRFSSSMDLTPEEQEQSSLYTTILKYEQDHVRLAEAVESQAEAEPSGSLPVVRALLLPPQVVLGWGGALLGARGLLAGAPCRPLPVLSASRSTPSPSSCSQLQCAVYTRLYPAVTWGTADTTVASPTGLSFHLLGPRGGAGSEPPKASTTCSWCPSMAQLGGSTASPASPSLLAPAPQR
ncbi:VPS9 domain-containing protein 1-like isoform X2 [Pezoporus wallicus]|uniref:VPS9 domain-containing protein 1-like isoform X2 n=1 Tax=Pezoporus wallicus TaxID=35540 RepID=UPI00254C0C32|nr:VPS9 domain-containing protein 1-like isoform X2 [Pezoporus wallicus]